MKSRLSHLQTRIRSSLAHSPFVRATAIVFVGSSVAQLAMLLASPIITRLYTIETFGIFGFFAALASTVGAVACLRYDQPVILAPSREKSTSLVVLALAIASVVTLLAVGAMGLAVGPFPERFAGMEPIAWVVAVPAAIFGIAAFEVFAAYFTREKQFRMVAGVNLLRTCLTIAIQLSASALHALGLVLGFTLSALLSTVPMLASRRRPPMRSVTREQLAESLREYRDFPFYNAPQGLLNSISSNAPIFVLTWASGPAAAGAYAMSVRLLQRPMDAIVGPVRQVFFQRAAELFHSNPSDLHRFFRKVTLSLAAIIVPPCILFFFFGAQLLDRILGSEWSQVGEQSHWLILWLSVGFFNSPAVILTRVFRLQREMLVFFVVLLVARTTGLAWGASEIGPVEGVAIYSLIGAAFNIGLVGFVYVRSSRMRTAFEAAHDSTSEPGGP